MRLGGRAPAGVGPDTAAHAVTGAVSRPAALLFDFDGLILDTETCAYDTVAEIFAENDRVLLLSLASGLEVGIVIFKVDHLVGRNGHDH